MEALKPYIEPKTKRLAQAEGEPVTSPKLDPIAATLERCRLPNREDDPPRKPGRPLKRTPDYYRGLLAAYATAEAWFVGEHSRRPRSAQQLLTAYFAHCLNESFERPTKANAPRFQGGIKTLRNELSEARRLFSVPQTMLLPGCTTSDSKGQSRPSMAIDGSEDRAK